MQRYLSLLVFAVILAACSDSSSTATTATPSATKKQTDTAPEKKSIYAFDAWSAEASSRISVNNVNDVFSVLDLSPTNKKSDLDYSGDEATLYHLRSAKQAEFLNVNNSLNYLELSWLKPSDGDGSESQARSLENTKKAYVFARSTLGDKGGELVKSMVENPDFVAPQIIDGKTITSASCESFLCRIVIKK